MNKSWENLLIVNYILIDSFWWSFDLWLFIICNSIVDDVQSEGDSRMVSEIILRLRNFNCDQIKEMITVKDPKSVSLIKSILNYKK